MIDLAILGLLKEQDLHGYELRKRLGDLPGARSGAVSFGALDPAGARLQPAGRVTGREAGTRTGTVGPSRGPRAGGRGACRARTAASPPASDPLEGSTL